MIPCSQRLFANLFEYLVGGGVPSAPLVGLRAPRTPQVGGGVPSAPYGLAV